MNLSPTRPFADPAVLGASVALWALAVIVASLSGALSALADGFMPAFAALVVIGIVVPTALYFTLGGVRDAVDRLGLHRITLLHAWRVPAGLLFLGYGFAGLLPAWFAALAGIGDILAGLAAASLLGRRPSLAAYRLIHWFGFADFVVAVGTGLTFTLLGDPRMATLTTLPMALIPLFGVGLSGASHLIALSSLTRRPG